MSPVTDHVDTGGGLLSPVAEYDAEFRAYEDDAWYAVRVSLRERALRINYVNLDDVRDNFFEGKDFESLKELEDFIRRFRPLSLQLQDHECSTVFQGMRVCASHSFSSDDVSFYDGLIEKVEPCTRSEDEECSCRFTILWEHGPNAGNLTKSGIESICKIQHRKELNPAISVFFKIVNERVNCSTASNSISKRCFWERLKQGKRCAKRSKCKIRPSEGAMAGSSSGNLRSTNQDVDVGGVSSKYTILLENVDKGLSASTISAFLQRHSLVLSQVYICPSLPWEVYTRAIITLDCESKLKRISNFLENPDHIVVSSTGRPLVIVEKLTGLDTIQESALALIPVSNKSFFSGNGSELKVVSSGSVEYMTAKRLRDLFNEFFAQQKRLHQRFAVEEGSIFFS